MKKIKLDVRLSLNKETIATLNDNQMNAIKGGKGFMSIGEYCTKTANCPSHEHTKGLFCNPDHFPSNG